MLKVLLDVIRIVAVYTILCVSIFLMMKSVILYGTFRTDIQFLAVKQDYLPNAVWKTAFYLHVFSAVFALFAGLTQFSNQFLNDYRGLHRKIGWAYVFDILIINFPAALIMGVYANGGTEGKIAFLLLDFLWFGFTLQALRSAIAKDFLKHRDYMIRSYAMTFSAITLRTWKIILVNSSLRDHIDVYLAEAWLGFLPNLMVAELIIAFIRRRSLAAKNH